MRTVRELRQRMHWQELRGIDVTSAGVYENELFRMFSYPVSGVTIDDAYRSDVMRSPPGCGMRNWRIV